MKAILLTAFFLVASQATCMDTERVILTVDPKQHILFRGASFSPEALGELFKAARVQLEKEEVYNQRESSLRRQAMGYATPKNLGVYLPIERIEPKSNL